jgi:hypothetical protein
MYEKDWDFFQGEGITFDSLPLCVSRQRLNSSRLEVGVNSTTSQCTPSTIKILKKGSNFKVVQEVLLH